MTIIPFQAKILNNTFLFAQFTEIQKSMDTFQETLTLLLKKQFEVKYLDAEDRLFLTFLTIVVRALVTRSLDY